MYNFFFADQTRKYTVVFGSLFLGQLISLILFSSWGDLTYATVALGLSIIFIIPLKLGYDSYLPLLKVEGKKFRMISNLLQETIQPVLVHLGAILAWSASVVVFAFSIFLLKEFQPLYTDKALNFLSYAKETDIGIAILCLVLFGGHTIFRVSKEITSHFDIQKDVESSISPIISNSLPEEMEKLLSRLNNLQNQRSNVSQYLLEEIKRDERYHMLRSSAALYGSLAFAFLVLFLSIGETTGPETMRFAKVIAVIGIGIFTVLSTSESFLRKKSHRTEILSALYRYIEASKQTK